MKLRILNRWIILILVVISVAAFTPVQSVASEPVEISLRTLDDRPPNNLMVKQIAAIAGIDLTIVFGQKDSPEEDCVSINAAVADSLIGSRSADPCSLEPPTVRPDALLHFAVPRAQPTVTEQGMAGEYSRVLQELADVDVQRTALNAVRNGSLELEDRALASYVDRIRGWIDFLERADYDPDRLLITLDDNRPGPLSDGLKILFGQYSHYVTDGTDEGMMLLIARALRERQIDPPSTIGMVFTAPGDLVSTQPLESGMMIENILLMTDWLGLRISPNIGYYEPWRPVFWFHGAGAYSSNIEYLIRETSASVGDRPVIVADIARVNGGDELLIDVWRDGAAPSNLCGYLAWNTCSNTIGSAIALWASIDYAYEHTADPEGVRAGIETFLWSRFLDDYFYQTQIRTEISNIARSEGADLYNLSVEESAHLVDLITQRLNEVWNQSENAIPVPLRFVEPLSSTGFVVELPWNRLFEIELFINDRRGVLPTIRPITEK